MVSDRAEAVPHPDRCTVKFQFRTRVQLFSKAGESLGFFGAVMIEPLIASGRASVKNQERVKGELLIASVQLCETTPDLDSLGLKPGSFGIARVHSPYGLYFEHHKPWDELVVPTHEESD